MVTIFGSTFFAIDLRFRMFQFDVSCLHAALQLSPVFSKGVGRYVFLTKAYSYPCAGLEGSLWWSYISFLWHRVDLMLASICFVLSLAELLWSACWPPILFLVLVVECRRPFCSCWPPVFFECYPKVVFMLASGFLRVRSTLFFEREPPVLLKCWASAVESSSLHRGSCWPPIFFLCWFPCCSHLFSLTQVYLPWSHFFLFLLTFFPMINLRKPAAWPFFLSIGTYRI